MEKVLDFLRKMEYSHWAEIHQKQIEKYWKYFDFFPEDIRKFEEEINKFSDKISSEAKEKLDKLLDKVSYWKDAREIVKELDEKRHGTTLLFLLIDVSCVHEIFAKILEIVEESHELSTYLCENKIVQELKRKVTDFSKIRNAITHLDFEVIDEGKKLQYPKSEKSDECVEIEILFLHLWAHNIYRCCSAILLQLSDYYGNNKKNRPN